MNVSSLQALTRRLTKTDTTTYSDANLLIDININYGKRMLDVMDLRTDKNTGVQDSYTDLISITGLVDGQNGYRGEYAFPSGLVKPFACLVSFDGTTYNFCTPYELSDRLCDELTEDSINGVFSENNPYVRFDRDSYFIRPLPDTTVSQGIHVWYEKRQSDLTTGSPDFETNLHDLIAYDCAEGYAIMNPDNYSNTWLTRLQSARRDEENRFAKFYKNRFKRNIKLSPIYNNYS